MCLSFSVVANMQATYPNWSPAVSVTCPSGAAACVERMHHVVDRQRLEGRRIAKRRLHGRASGNVLELHFAAHRDHADPELERLEVARRAKRITECGHVICTRDGVFVVISSDEFKLAKLRTISNKVCENRQQRRHTARQAQIDQGDLVKLRQRGARFE